MHKTGWLGIACFDTTKENLMCVLQAISFDIIFFNITNSPYEQYAYVEVAILIKVEAKSAICEMLIV